MCRCCSSCVSLDANSCLPHEFMLPSRQGGAEVECDWFTDGCVFLHYPLMRCVKPKSTYSFWKKCEKFLFWSGCFCVAWYAAHWVERLLDQSRPSPWTWMLHIICCWQSPHPQLPQNNSCKGTSGKLAVAFSRGRILTPVFFHCCTEGSWRTL